MSLSKKSAKTYNPKGEGMKSFTLTPHATARLLATRQKSLLVTSPKLVRTTTTTTQHGRNINSSNIPSLTNDLNISYSFHDSRFYGPVLIARTTKGVCAVLLGGTTKSKVELQEDLSRRFPRSRLSNPKENHNLIDANGPTIDELLCNYLDNPTQVNISAEDIPLDLQGTTFQRSVWKALQEIPMAKVETYAQLAHRAKLPPSSARAVANACGQNHVAFLVPCHRIVRSDGGMGGYHWGVEIKEKMLSLEKCPKDNLYQQEER